MASSVLIAAPVQAEAASAVLRARLVAALAIIALWEIVALIGPAGGKVVPHLTEIGFAIGRLLTNPAFYQHVLWTAAEVVASLGIGFLMAIGVIMLTIRWRTLEAGLSVVFSLLAPTPKIIFFPVALSLFGVGGGSKILIGALSAFFPIVISISMALRRVDGIYLDVARGFGMNTFDIARKVYAPALFVATLTAIRLGAGLTIIGVLLSEMKLSAHGLGFLAQSFYSGFRTNDLYAVILVAFVLAASLNALISHLESRARHHGRNG